MKDNNRKGRRKGRKSRIPQDYRDERQSKEEESDRSMTKGMNDVSWYTRNPNLSAAAAQIPFPYRPGMTLHLTDSAAITGAPVIPGVMSLRWLPSVGHSGSATDPASIAAKEIYAKVRSAFSGSLDADAPDFIMYLMALDSIYAYIAWLKRVFRTLNAYTPDNYQTPEALLLAMGIPATAIPTLREDKMQLWQAINTLVLSSRKFTCPALMDVMNRHYWLSDNVYTDAASANAQFYLFTPEGLYNYAEVAIPGDENGNTAAGLEYVPLYNQSLQPWTVRGLLLYGTNMIDRLVAWDDAYTISGYLKRAYEGAPSFIVEEIGYDATLEPVYSEEVLTQIENSRTILGGVGLDYTKVKVAQNPLDNTVRFNPMFAYRYLKFDDSAVSVAVENSKHILSMRSDAPTAADNIIATRLHAINTLMPASGSTPAYANVTCATEIPLCWTIHSYSQETGKAYEGVIEPILTLYKSATGAEFGKTLNRLALMSQFDWAPIININYVDENDKYHQILFGDVHNVTVVDKAVLANINRVCLFSEFNAFNF